MLEKEELLGTSLKSDDYLMIISRMFDDRIEVWNPGKLLGELTPESLKGKHESIPRNPLIAKMLFLIKEIEQWGTGTNEMVNMCIEHGLPEPEFEETDGSFVVTVRKRLTEEFLMEKGLNERQIEAVKFVREKNSIKNKEYRELFDVSKRTATSDLSELAEKGILKKGEKGGNRGTFCPNHPKNARKSEKDIKHIILILKIQLLDFYITYTHPHPTDCHLLGRSFLFWLTVLNGRKNH